MSAGGVPVAWAVVDRHGVLLPNSNEAAEVACFRTKDEADEELAYANQGEGAPPWEDSKPFAVVALAPTHPAAASAEREAQIRAEVIEECAKVCDRIVAARKRHPRHGARAGAVTTAVENVAHMIRALSARATKEVS